MATINLLNLDGFEFALITKDEQNSEQLEFTRL